jgi:Ca2+-binding RTX toxin-like protein
MTITHTSTRESLGLSATAPSAVTTYTITQNIGGFDIPTTVTDGTNGSDTFTAGANATYVFGFGGDDTISNEGSSAILLGGEGADTFVMHNNSTLVDMSDGSILDFEQGVDKINLSDYGITSFSELTIVNNTEGVAGTFADITSAAHNLKISVSATGGLDQLTAADFGFGDVDTGETLEGGDSTGGDITDIFGNLIPAVTIAGTNGSTTITGGADADIIFGAGVVADPDDGADNISGGAGNDYILGNGGADTIDGGIGNDTMHGGLGDDTYVFGTDSGTDTILWFEGAGVAGGDIIQIASATGISTTAAALAAVSYADGNAVLDLGSGNSVTIMSIADGSLAEVDFAIV